MFSAEGQLCSLLVLWSCLEISINILPQVINNSQFHDDERQSAILLIAQTSEMFREVTCGPLDTATLQAQFLRSLVEHSQYMCNQPVSAVEGSPDDGQAQERDTSYLSDLGTTENVMGASGTIPPPIAGTNPAMITHQHIADVDLSTLDGATWDQLMADWMANPDSHSLQYNDFVTNFASSSFVDVQQHEFPDHFDYT